LKRLVILAFLCVFFIGCIRERRLSVDKTIDKELVWVGSEREMRKLSDPAELKRRQEEARKDFNPPKTIESALYVCNAVRSVISGKDFDSATFLSNAPDELKKEYNGNVFLSVYGKRAKLFKTTAKEKNACEAALKAIKKLASITRGKLPQQTDSLAVKVEFAEKMLAAETFGAARQVFMQGVDGLLLLPESRGEYRLPAELMAFSPADKADIALYFTMLPQADTLRRFRTIAFLQNTANETPLKLIRSLPQIPEISAKILKERIAAACEYLIRNQREDGSYAYLYAANRDKFLKLPEESMVRHIATTAMLIIIGERFERKDFIDSATKSLAWIQKKTIHEKNHAYTLKEDQGSLGGAGVLTWALSHYRRVTGNTQYDQTARKAADFILFMQKPDATFCTFYDPVTMKPIDKPIRYSEGEACLGLYWYHKVYGGQKYLDAVIKGATAISERIIKQFALGSHPVDAWLMQTVRFLYPLADEKQQEKMLSAVTKMAQVMVDAQRTTAESAGYPDLVGVFSGLSLELPSGPASAALCEGLAATCLLLESIEKPAEEIRATLLRAAQSHLRHQLWKENMYFLPNPSRASGGVKSTLTDNQVRIDHVQHTAGVWLQILDLLE
jgi:hypothetical protein